MKTIKLSEKEAKGIMSVLEASAGIFDLLKISAFKFGNTKDYLKYSTNKSEALLAGEVMKRAYDKAV